MRFPDIAEIITLGQSEYEKEFLRCEFDYGLDYYIGRLDQLMFRGEKVLDAGCGAGQWSIALAQRFRHVMAVDVNPERLSILQKLAARLRLMNIDIGRGSIEKLSYDREAFDAIFCYGVIMLTKAEKALAEFFRILRPGGRVYLCLNADGWSRYLIQERGRQEQRIKEMGQKTLYSTYWHRAISEDVIWKFRSSYSLLAGVLRRMREWQPASGRRKEGDGNAQVDASGEMDLLALATFSGRNANAYPLTQEEGRGLTREIAAQLLQHVEKGRRLEEDVRRHCGEEFGDRLLDDVWAAIQGRDLEAELGPVRAYQPDEFERIVLKAGFRDFQWYTEGRLICDWTGPEWKPKYNGYYEPGDLSVWECLFLKPAHMDISVSPGFHYQLAMEGQKNPVYVETSPDPILSNGNYMTFPRLLLQHYQRLSETVGWRQYLRELGKQLLKGAKDETDVAERIIVFVQQAIFRDPIAQPLTEDGGLPDSMTILMCARGRCHHIAKVLVDLCGQAGMAARLKQLRRHVIAEICVDGRWVIADADAFKAGIIPRNAEGRLLSMEDLLSNPYQLDRFPPTGWMVRPCSRLTRGFLGYKVKGYVDALEPEKRGFLSGFYIAEAEGYPPSLPVVFRFQKKRNKVILSWRPSTMRKGRLLGYRVSVGTCSRGWSYYEPGEGNAILKSTSRDVLKLETGRTEVEFNCPSGPEKLFASVVAYSDRVEKEPETFFWPSEETCLELDKAGI